MAGVENLNLNPELSLAARNLEEKWKKNWIMWINLFEIKLPLLDSSKNTNFLFLMILMKRKISKTKHVFHMCDISIALFKMCPDEGKMRANSSSVFI